MPTPPEWETLTFFVALFAAMFAFGIGCSVTRFVQDRQAKLRDLRNLHSGSDTVS